MKFWILAPVLNLLASYVYTIEMGDALTVVFLLTNMLAAGAWLMLGYLIRECRKEYSQRSVVFSWIKPLTYALKLFCAVSFVRCAVNVLVYWFPAFQPIQASTFIAHNICLAIACGYASIYYNKIPGFLDRAAKHQRNSRRFDVFMDRAADAMIEIDENSDIWYANVAAAKMFGFAREDLLGRSITELMPEPQRKKHLLGIERFVASHGADGKVIGQSVPTRLTALRGNGDQFPIDLTLTDYTVNGTRRFCAIIRDVSYLVKLEADAAAG